MGGEKIRIDDALNQEVIVTGCRIAPTKYDKNKSGKCLTLQIKIDEQKRVVFTGSDIMIEQMEKHEDQIPFSAVIKKINRYYTLT